MSQSFRGKNTQDNATYRKCRIPQRLGSGKHRPLSKTKELRDARPKSENGRKIHKQNIIDGNRPASLDMPQEPIFSGPKINSENCENHKEHFSDGHTYENNGNVRPYLDATKQQTDPVQLKMDWMEKRDEFDKMRNNLNERQGTIMEAYADLKTTEERLVLLGQTISSPIIDDDLRIMNVAKMTPQQLLQLCGETKACNGDKEDLATTYFNIDMKTMYNIPSKVFETCEDTIKKSKELLDWLESLKQNEKDILCNSKHKRKINEFKTEYDMLSNKVQDVKTELSKDLTEITDVIRKCMNETIAVSLRNEDLSYELSQLNSKNSLLQKQINDKDHVFKLHPNKIKIEELDKKLKEEKLKNVTVRDRLKKFETEAKMNENRAIRLEVALDQARAQNRVLERTIQNQRDQNQQSQKEFNEELCKLTDSIKENSKNLERIADAKTKLQHEKEELEKRLNSLSEKYNKTINNLRIEIAGNARKIVEMEKKYKEEVAEKAKLQNTIQTQQSQIMKKDDRHRETLKLLHDTEAKLSEALMERGNMVKVVKAVEENLEVTKKEIENLNKNVMEKNKSLEEMQEKLDASKRLEGQLRQEMNKKIKHIEDQQNNFFSLEDKAKESELKIQFYEKELISLKEHIKNLKDKLEEYENLNGLKNTITEQNQKIQELNQRNDELTKALHNQAIDLKAYMHTISAQEDSIKEKDELLNELSEKEKEQSNIIALLQKNLATKVNNKIDEQVSQILIEKDSEIKSLIVDVGTKEKRISQMEKIMITLYDQTQKTKSKNKKYQEKINILKQVISEYETYIDNMNLDPPSENLDSLIQILESEMETAIIVPSNKHNFETEFLNKKRDLINTRQMPYIVMQRDRSLNRAEPLLDDHSGHELQATHSLSLVEYPENYPNISVSTAKHNNIRS